MKKTGWGWNILAVCMKRTSYLHNGYGCGLVSVKFKELLGRVRVQFELCFCRWFKVVVGVDMRLFSGGYWGAYGFWSRTKKFQRLVTVRDEWKMLWFVQRRGLLVMRLRRMFRKMWERKEFFQSESFFSQTLFVNLRERRWKKMTEKNH